MSQKLKIGLLLDSLKVPRWVYDLILQLKSDESYELNMILINKGPKMASRSSLIYRVLRKIDERLFAFGASPFSRKSINIGNAKIVEVNPIRKKFSDYFPDEVIDQIEADKPDLFLRFGFRILRGKILSASQYGILSLHHGDTASYRGGPPAFWEVIENSKTTGVTLQILTEALDSGIILSKTILRTDTNSFYRNQQKIYWAGSKLFIEQLNQMAKIGVDNYLASKQSVYANEPKGKLYRNPNHSTSLIILVQFVLRTIKRQLISFFTTNQWTILISRKTNGNHFMNLPSFHKINPPKDRIWADPFLITENGHDYLFFEEKLNKDQNAHLAMFQLDESGKPKEKNPTIIIKEPFHLSYPFVFKLNQHYYLIPESAATKCLYLYQAVEFPFKWERRCILIEGLHIYDATLFLHSDGLFYLFCTVKEDSRFSSDAYLNIFYSSNIEQLFIPHQMNPIYADVTKSRPAGKIFKHGNELIRPAQIGAPVYGHGIAFYKITELSPTSFKEELILEQPPINGFDATHTYNESDNFIVYDAQKKYLKII